MKIINKKLKEDVEDIIKNDHISISMGERFKYKGKEFKIDYKISSLEAIRQQEREKFDRDTKKGKWYNAYKYIENIVYKLSGILFLLTFTVLMVVLSK